MIDVGFSSNGWTVKGLHHKDSKWNKYYSCVCDNCGEESIFRGQHIRDGKISECQCYKINRMVGKKFGYLTIIGLHKVERHTFWLCRCCCGNDHIVREGHLLEGNITSCGCMKYEKSRKHFRKALLGKKFGKWNVLDFAFRKKDGNVYRLHWLCRCECGVERTVSGTELTSGNSLSCGCSRISRGEETIVKILDELDVVYHREYSFEDCIDIRNLRFDFYLPDHDICIEFHGKQHFEAVDHFGGEDRFEDQIKKDKIKKEYCKANGIILLEIPYDEKNIKDKVNFVIKNVK